MHFRFNDFTQFFLIHNIINYYNTINHTINTTLSHILLL